MFTHRFIKCKLSRLGYMKNSRLNLLYVHNRKKTVIREKRHAQSEKRGLYNIVYIHLSEVRKLEFSEAVC